MPLVPRSPKPSLRTFFPPPCRLAPLPTRSGGQGQNKNLAARIHALDEQVVRQQELLYNVEFQLQQMERKVRGGRGLEGGWWLVGTGAGRGLGAGAWGAGGFGLGGGWLWPGAVYGPGRTGLGVIGKAWGSTNRARNGISD